MTSVHGLQVGACEYKYMTTPAVLSGPLLTLTLLGTG